MLGQDKILPGDVAGEKLFNVKEAWPIYDTLIISPVFYGAESQNRGWFTSVAQFAAQPTHSFFKARTEASAGLCYCNKQSADSMDFAYKANTVGVAFFAPGVRPLSQGPSGLGDVDSLNTQTAHWWETVLPRHCSLELKVQQDIVLELPSLAASPGYGPQGGGASFEHEQVGYIAPNGSGNADYLPVMNMAVTQGVPQIVNRWSLGREPLGIPRTATIEAIIRLSEIAQYELQQLTQQYYYFKLPEGGGPGRTQFPARFGIQVSLLGHRLVQQRGQYWS